MVFRANANSAEILMSIIGKGSFILPECIDLQFCKRCVFRVLVGKPEGNNHLGDLGVDGRTILRLIFRKWDVGYGLDRAGSG